MPAIIDYADGTRVLDNAPVCRRTELMHAFSHSHSLQCQLVSAIVIPEQFYRTTCQSIGLSVMGRAIGRNKSADFVPKFFPRTVMGFTGLSVKVQFSEKLP